MKKILTTSLILCFATIIALGQTLVTAQFLGSKTKNQLIAQLGNPFIKNGIKYYKVIYETPDVQGNTSLASALMAIPDDTTQIYPMVCYQHGTSSSKDDVPSKLNGEAILPQMFGGLGFITITPDYLGLGDSPGFHPYVHAATEASAGADALRALADFADDEGICYQKRVFLTGYSQGGHASAALHRLLDQSNEFNVVAAAHLSGPYSISGVMRDLLFSDEPYSRPAYLINTLFSYQYVYGNLYTDLAEVVKPVFLAKCSDYYNGTISLLELNDFLVAELTLSEGAPIANRVFNDDFKSAVETNPNHPANIAMADNDVLDWVPTVPTRFFYCTADDQVPYQNSLVAEAALNTAGATNVDAVDVGATLDHVACVPPALTNTTLLFLALQNLQPCPQVSRVVDVALPFDIYPNPAGEVFFVKNFPSNGQLLMTNMQGRVQLRQSIAEGDNEIGTGGLQDGLYFVDFQGETGSFRTKMMVMQ
ncbi:MAG: T9SS type A sorting domain-containing protein [Saprospiraceae bacterium]|nr:T9SS type A sorting domain-containing protein [Saprospiraceae bacterium]MCF8249150.1 T9SS type A sorting domain-containing protein [Saprospiraceae bacterium]MCF8278908.1 T9SS type A sorting domain-containing protein [Bacteroidales bacterium]MCF8311279.1 T9SS type A sorting domain-containing protein [Saprospiraceae bacterium]MCF8440157.1 T9SS type A sorting domain-containing protein [Saprospiraceae bacterium]